MRHHKDREYYFSNRRTKSIYSFIAHHRGEHCYLVGVPFTLLGISTHIKVQDIDEDIFSLFDRFEKKMFGENADPYNLTWMKQKEDSYTYLVYDGTYYKIGQSKNPFSRVQALRTANPNCEIVCHGLYVPEKFLHFFFRKKKVKNEWFDLNSLDVDMIKTFMSSKHTEESFTMMRLALPNKKHPPRTKERPITMDFGKYKGREIASMLNNEVEKNYLIWANSNIKNKYSKCLKEIERLLEEEKRFEHCEYEG